MLLHFISDLLRDEQKKRAFSQDPLGFIRAAGLSQEEQQAVLSRDRERILALIGRSLSEVHPVGWPGKAVAITPPVQPGSGTPGESLPAFTINGDFFDQDVKANIELGATRVDVVVEKVSNPGAQGCSLTGRLTLPANLPAGRYTVRVANGTSPDEQATLPSAFQVESSRQ